MTAIATTPTKTTEVKTRKRRVSRSRRFVDREGTIWKLSRLITFAQAQAFCRCMAANKGVTEAQFRRSKRAKGEKAWYVLWQPTNPVLRDEMYDEFQLQRIRTAEKQADVMSVYPLTEGGLQKWLVVNDDLHGEGFHFVELAAGVCDCSDFYFRCQHVGARCHHLVEVQRRADAGQLEGYVLPTTAVIRPLETAKERRARLMAAMEKDF